MGIEIDHIEGPHTLLNKKEMPIKGMSLTVVCDMSISWYFLFKIREFILILKI